MLFLGDSLVAGVGDPAGGGWVARIVSACFAQGTPLSAYNLGVRRETSVAVAARWRGEAIPRMLAGADHRVVVCFGANDTTLEHGALRVGADDSRLALAGILEEAGALGFAPFIVGPAAVDDTDQNRRIADLTASFAEVCDQRGIPFVGLVESLLSSPVWMSEVTAGDGAHPGARGYDELASALVEGGLLDWLTEPRRDPVVAPQPEGPDLA